MSLFISVLTFYLVQISVKDFPKSIVPAYTVSVNCTVMFVVIFRVELDFTSWKFSVKISSTSSRNVLYRRCVATIDNNECPLLVIGVNCEARGMGHVLPIVLYGDGGKQ